MNRLLICSIFLALAGTAQAKNYPPGGNVSGLTVSKSSVTAGESVTFTVTGTGKCAYQIGGLSGVQLWALKGSGALPHSLTVTVPEAGNFNLGVDPTRETTDPMWCTGVGGTKLTVKPKPLAESAPVLQQGMVVVAGEERTRDGGLPAPPVAKVMLTSLTLAQALIPPSNTTTLTFSLAAQHAVAKCMLTYELRTNDPGADTINLSLIGPLDFNDFSNPGASGWTLPAASRTQAFGTLMGADHNYKTGKMRFYLRAKADPTNTCIGEAHADFEISKSATPAMGQNAAQFSQNVLVATDPSSANLPQVRLTGISLGAKWYDFYMKKSEITVLGQVIGKGDPKSQCGYQVDVHNDTLNKDFPGVIKGQSTIVPSMGYPEMSMDLPPGDYTVSVKPWAGSDTSIPACPGSGTAKGKVTIPADAMTLSGAFLDLINVTADKANFLATDKKTVSVTIDNLAKGLVHLRPQFKNYSTKGLGMGCTYVVNTQGPSGSFKDVYKQDINNVNTLDMPWTGLGNSSTPGTYKLHLDGGVLEAGVNTQTLGTSHPPCAGTADVTVVVLPTFAQVMEKMPLQIQQK